MPHNKPVPTNHFRAVVSSGSLYLGACSPEAVELLSAAFPDAAWPHDEDGTPYCDTGITVRSTEVVFDDEEPRTARPHEGHGPLWHGPLWHGLACERVDLALESHAEPRHPGRRLLQTITAHEAINDGRLFGGVRTPNASTHMPLSSMFDISELTSEELAAMGWGSWDYSEAFWNANCACEQLSLLGEIVYSP